MHQDALALLLFFRMAARPGAFQVSALQAANYHR
jgi:hypothetical protein